VSVNESFAVALKRLEGEQLSSIEFVRDYVQLRFDGPCLSVYNSHHIASNNSRISWGEPGYRDALCKLIAHTVERATLSDEGISLRFDNDAVWTLSLKKENSSGPEAYYFVDQEGNSWAD
jgi:hypothetical protein